jgi:hypothetical protein
VAVPDQPYGAAELAIDLQWERLVLSASGRAGNAPSFTLLDQGRPVRDSLRPAALKELLRRAGEHSLSFEADGRPETGQKDTALVRWACECCLAAGIRQRLSRKAVLRRGAEWEIRGRGLLLKCWCSFHRIQRKRSAKRCV